ncbi:MAG: ABC transporter permease [Pyrinomonadaceae bacterium]
MLVITEIALSFVLLVGAGLMMQSFLRLHQVSPGFNPKDVLTLGLTLPAARYPEPEQRADFLQQLLEGVRALPSVEAAGAVGDLPLNGGYGRGSLTVEGQPVVSTAQAPVVRHNVITPGYFQALGIPILMGRDFTEADTKGIANVTIIDEQVARDYWPNESPVGKRVRYDDDGEWHTIARRGRRRVLRAA